MICERNFEMEKETMPQTVPASGLSPPAYDYSAFAADCFDLSLLGADGEVPLSPPSLRHLISLYGPPATPPDHEHFPTTIFDHNIPHLKSPPPYHKPEPIADQYPDNAAVFEQFHLFGNQSPPSEDNSVPSIGVQPCSPLPTAYQTDATTPLLHTIKEEPSSLLLSPHYSNSPYPLSPSDSSASYNSPSYYSPISPQYTPQIIKSEAAIDIEELLKENQILQESIKERLLQPKKEEGIAKPRDYQLLREVLEDTTFQKRFNLRPLNIESLTAEAFSSSLLEVKMEVPDGSDTLMNEKIEPVLSLAIEQMRRDVDDTCSSLGISPDPTQWSCEDVKAWILWTLRHYSLPLVPVEYFAMDGASLVGLTEDDFIQRTPQAGSTLYAQLEIWKAARQEQWGAEAGPAWSEPPPSTSAPSVASSSGDVTEDEEESASTVAKAPSPKQGGSHIHLWQFLKELLASPQLHGSAIRWIDRSKGVFKIEDSVRVARLWGKRKNRPAMNYDKLSRSIRQYYKKGIMKKTERSQRLVYQFCHPYCL